MLGRKKKRRPPVESESKDQKDYYANQGYKVIRKDIEDSEVTKEPVIKYTRRRRR
jgi:hypothetical protein